MNANHPLRLAWDKAYQRSQHCLGMAAAMARSSNLESCRDWLVDFDIANETLRNATAALIQEGLIPPADMPALDSPRPGRAPGAPNGGGGQTARLVNSAPRKPRPGGAAVNPLMAAFIGGIQNAR